MSAKRREEKSVLKFPLIKLAKKLKEQLSGIPLQFIAFPLIKLAKKLKDFCLFCEYLIWVKAFPLIKLAKKLKDFISCFFFVYSLRSFLFPLIKLAKKLKVLSPSFIACSDELKKSFH